MNDERFRAALAGLTHDLGKVIQRASDQPSKMPEEGQPPDAAWTIRFAQEIPKDFRHPVLMGAYYHHPEQNPEPDSYLSYLVNLADELAAGEAVDAGPAQGKPPKQLLSIFNRIHSDQPEKPHTPPRYLKLSPLCLKEETIFPTEAVNKDQREMYRTMQQALFKAAHFETKSLEIYLEQFQSALQKYTWSVPASEGHPLPDSSLYDHSRMTAALAACLCELDFPTIKTKLGAVQRAFRGNSQPGDADHLDEAAVLLVGGDISGIQDFIYTISAKNAAKTLRGRSFYLQLLTEAVLRYVLSALDLPYTNVIYSGGGHFFLLAPLSTHSALESIRNEVSRILLDHHGISLYLAIGAAAVPYSGFKPGNLPIYWDQMHRQMNIFKQRRYAELKDSLYTLVFDLQKHAGNQEDHCAVCGEMRPHTQLIENDPDQARICPMCASFSTQIGKDLPNSDCVFLGLGTPVNRGKGTALDVLAAFGVTLRMGKDTVREVDFKETPVERVITCQLQDNTHPVNIPGHTPVPWLKYSVNRIPAETFDDLQKRAHGIHRLGVLRIDVDNLGNLFKSGFGKDKSKSIATLVRLSSLSFQISLFFEGWVKQITEGDAYCDQNGRRLIYSVYAGGDDLFLIGPWDKMPHLAQEINRDFQQYTGCNPEIHLSGGMTFIHGKYPLYQAAEDAGNALDEKAKQLPGKDGFTFLDQAWKWDQFKSINDKFDQLYDLVENKKAPHSLLQTLQKLGSDQKSAAQKQPTGEKPLWGPWMWRGSYFLKRMIETHQKKNEEISTRVGTILDSLTENHFTNLPEWAAAARWVQLYIRKNESDELDSNRKI